MALFYLMNFAYLVLMLIYYAIDSLGNLRQVEIVVMETDAAPGIKMTPDEIEITSHIVRLVVSVYEAEDEPLSPGEFDPL